MKLATFEIERARFPTASCRDDGIVDAGARLEGRFPDLLAVISAGALDELERFAARGTGGFQAERDPLLKPIPNPGKILCVGVNYPGRAAEYKDNPEQPKYPSIFVRFPASLVAHEEPIVRPPESKQLDYEGEIALVIGPGAARPAHRGKRCARARRGLHHLQRGHDPRLAAPRKIQRHAGKKLRRNRRAGPWMVTSDEIGPVRCESSRE